MRIATFNVENLFDRAKAMNLENWDQGQPVLEAFSALNTLLGQQVYSEADKRRMVELMKTLGLEGTDTGPFVLLRRSRGALLKRPKEGDIVITAAGRADWAGSLELRDAPVTEEAMRNTARVIGDVKADVMALVEVESRPVLSAFNTQILPAVDAIPFDHVMVIDGNDERGIDVGIATRADYPIGDMRSHVDDRLPNGQPIFSRDCAEYEIHTPSGQNLLLLLNHFKSKGFGSKATSDARRKAQAARVAEIYKQRIADGYSHIAVLGDFNDTPGSAALAPLLSGTDLKDVFGHASFDNGGYPGTYGLCNADNKIDYILLSPELFGKVTAGGVFRKGAWPGSRPKRWDVYPEVARLADAASDHSAVWVDLAL